MKAATTRLACGLSTRACNGDWNDPYGGASDVTRALLLTAQTSNEKRPCLRSGTGEKPKSRRKSAL
jgi:hypothetical protein